MPRQAIEKLEQIVKKGNFPGESHRYLPLRLLLRRPHKSSSVELITTATSIRGWIFGRYAEERVCW